MKTSPAPSQSDEVMRGGCKRINWRSRKNRANAKSHSDLIRARRALSGVRSLKCGSVRRYSALWYFFWIGYLCEAKFISSYVRVLMVISTSVAKSGSDNLLPRPFFRGFGWSQP